MTSGSTKNRHPRGYLAWEIGGGRGHIVTLAHIAKALKHEGVECVAGLRSLEHVGELEGLISYAQLAPTLPYFEYLRTFLQKPPAATYADFIGDLGYFSTTIISAHLAIWRQLILAADVDFVVCEHSPTALLAARSLGLPAFVCGNAYAVPPSNLPEMPVLLCEFNQRLWSEDTLCQAINAATRPFGLAPLLKFAQLLEADDSLVWGLKLLDPYLQARASTLLSPPIECVSPKDYCTEKRDEIFIYLSVQQCRNPGIFDALLQLPMPRRAFVPGLPEDLAVKFYNAGVIVETAPISSTDIARRSRLLVHAGNFGSVCLGVQLGLPQISIPAQGEHLSNGRRHAASGAGHVIEYGHRSVANVSKTILDVYESAGARESALRLRDVSKSEFQHEFGRAAAEIILRKFSIF